MKLNNYSFESHWHIPAAITVVVPLISDVEKWPEWWPGLESAVVKKETEDLVGSTATMVWQAMSGYKIHLRLHITHLQPNRSISYDSAGDLAGHGSWTFREVGTKTDMIIKWQVHTTKVWMNLLTPLLKPIFKYNHRRMMRQGEKGLIDLLKQQ